MNEGPVILVVDDELQIRRLLRLSLDAHGYRIKEADTAKDGLKQTALSMPDLILLDIGLPDMDGLAFIKNLRTWNQTPVIVISVRNTDQDKIDLLDAGANDYITKPFSMGELLARIRSALRHTIPENSEGVFVSGDLAIDFSKRSVLKNGNEIKLTPTEYSLLKLLVRNSGKVLTHGQIVKELWGPDASPDASYLRVYMLQLRKKIEAAPSNPKMLITEPGIGYRFVSE